MYFVELEKAFDWEVVWEYGVLACCYRLLWCNHSETLVYIAGY